MPWHLEIKGADTIAERYFSRADLLRDNATMTEPQHKIPENLSTAFCDAVLDYRTWDRGGPEPKRFIGSNRFEISAICDLVWNFTDEMPDLYYQVICYEVANPLDVPKDHSYASGARCLKKLIEVRKARYAQKH
jgi:hypothetical protein